MSDAAEPIRLENVWKLYGHTTALAGLTLAVPRGSLFGFLGPNGAGKSTAIRLLLGLQQPSRGSVSLFGRQIPKARVAVLRRVGSMVESPSPYLHLTGRENLEVHRRLLGLPRAAIEEALRVVAYRYRRESRDQIASPVIEQQLIARDVQEDRRDLALAGYGKRPALGAHGRGSVSCHLRTAFLQPASRPR
jgi:ABC-type multidrug transport system ATPase subunit